MAREKQKGRKKGEKNKRLTDYFIENVSLG